MQPRTALECSELFPDKYVAGTLDAAQREELERHLARGCGTCTRAVAEARRRIDPGTRGSGRQVEEWTPPSASMIGKWALAITIALTLALLLVGAALYQENREMARALRGVEIDTTIHRARERELERRLSRYQEAARTLSAPGTLHARVGTGQPAGRLVLQSESGVMFAWDFPPAPPDRIYALWLYPANRPAPVAAGVFVPDENGYVLHTWKAPVNVAEVRAAAVTTEPPGGGPLPTGTVLFNSPVTK